MSSDRDGMLQDGGNESMMLEPYQVDMASSCCNGMLREYSFTKAGPGPAVWAPDVGQATAR